MKSMEEINCPKCGQKIADRETRYCPKCGADIQSTTEPWICQKCGQENTSDALFCKACGYSHEKQLERESTTKGQLLNFVQSKRFLFCIVVVIVMLVGGFGSYYYFNNINETKYLTAYAEAARDIENANNILSGNIKVDVLKGNNADDLTKQMQEQKNILDEMALNFSQQKPFAKYETQHNNVITLLHKESTLLEQVIQLINKPLDNNTDSIIENIKENINDIKSMNTQIQVPNATFVSSIDLSTVPQQLNVYVTEQKQINKEKMEKLAAYQDFFKKMDGAIQRYEAARKDLGTVRDAFKKEGFMWNDYLDALDRAKSSRSGVRYTVSEIDPPAGTEGLKQKFLSVLDDSIRYCDTLSAAGNLQRWNYYWQSIEKEKSANDMNQEVQDGYAAFTENYQAEKVRLTNVNNL